MNRREHLTRALKELHAANVHMSGARDWLFDLEDAGFIRGEVADVKAALSVAITHLSRQIHREFPGDG